MGSLLDLHNHSLARVLKSRALEEAMLVVILRSSTPGETKGLMQMEAVEVAADGVMSRQILGHCDNDRVWEILCLANGTCVGQHD